MLDLQRINQVAVADPCIVGQHGAAITELAALQGGEPRGSTS